MTSSLISPDITRPERLRALHDTGLLDSAPEEAFDKYTRLAAAVLDAPVALMSLVDRDRQFFKSCVGLSAPWSTARETPLTHSFCQHPVAFREPLMVEDARDHPLVRENLAVPELNVQAYLGVPLITSEGHALGAFCVIDVKPRRWTGRDLAIVRDIAAAVITEIDLRAQMKNARSEALQRREAERRLRVEHAATIALTQSPDVEHALEHVLDAIRDSYGWDWSAVWVVDESADVLRCKDSRCAPPFESAEFAKLSRETTLARGVGLPGRAWATGEPAWIVDVQQDANFPRQSAARTAGLHAGFCLPVGCESKVVAVLEFLTREPQPVDEALLATLGAIGGHIGQFIERKRAEKELRLNQARLAAVIDSALDCIVGMDHQGRVTEWNPAAERTFGYTREEALGAEMAALVVPADLRARHRAGLARYLDGGPGPVLGKRLELTAMRRDGAEFPVELTVTRVDAEGPPAFTGYIRDITDRKQIERERDDLLASERAARIEATRANRLKDEFLATVSHELRTPLSAILGYAQLLKLRQLDRVVAEGLEVIERNARVQSDIINDLLDMSRIISGKLRLDVQRVELTEVVDAALETVRPAAEAKGIRLARTVDPGAIPVSGDPSRLQQVVWNLLTNAVKFTPKGGRVHVVVRRVSSHVELSVTDTGQGIRPDFLPHVFDKFSQAEGTTTRLHGGLGLGLAIVKNLTEMHGGSVRAQSKGEGQGATFTVELPLLAVRGVAETNVDATTTAAGRAAEYGDVHLDGIRVLAVDDEPDSRELIRRILAERGAAVITASSATEALSVLQRERVDLLLSDIGMPDIDGYELVRRVRTLPPEAGRNVPAAALTAFARTEDRTRALIAGYQTHIAKPVEPLELVAAVASLARGTTSG